MDPRLLELFNRQQASGFPGLAGSDARATIRIAAPLLNDAVTTALAAKPAVRDVSVQPRASNRFDVRLTLARPAFLPSLNLTLVIERQPELPADPVLGMRITGAGGMMRLAAPAITSFGLLPPGVQLDGDHLMVNLRTLLQQHGQAALLDYAEQMQVMTEEGALILLVQVRIK
jgi:hypothetical protein